MPIIGKKEESEPKKREIKWIPAKLVHRSRIIPLREKSKRVKRSVEIVGQQQPIIGRPCACNWIPEAHFEIVDGHNRHAGVNPELLIWVDIRYGLTNYEAFKLADTIHKRDERDTFSQAFFYGRMVETAIKESKTEKGIKRKVAIDCGINPDLLSQYLKLVQLEKALHLLKAGKRVSDDAIKHLSSWGINRLYALARLVEYQSLLAKAVKKIMSTNRDFSVDGVRKLVSGLLHGDEKGVRHQQRAIGGYSYALSLSFVDMVKDLIHQREDSQIYQKTPSDKEMVKRTTFSLAEIGYEIVKNNPDYFGEVYETDKDGKVIFCGFKRIDENPEWSLNALRSVDKEKEEEKEEKFPEIKLIEVKDEEKDKT